MFIQKEDHSCIISQFRIIALLNVEGEIFFGVLVRRMSNFLMANECIDTDCKKAELPRFGNKLER